VAKYKVVVKWSFNGSSGTTATTQMVEAESDAMASQIALDKVRSKDSHRDKKTYFVDSVKKQ
jgi:hypothetical protein